MKSVNTGRKQNVVIKKNVFVKNCKSRNVVVNAYWNSKIKIVTDCLALFSNHIISTSSYLDGAALVSQSVQKTVDRDEVFVGLVLRFMPGV